jgi:hypothetical protein
MKQLILFATLTFLVGCSPDVERAKQEALTAERTRDAATSQTDKLRSQAAELSDEIKRSSLMLSGKHVDNILKIEISQSHFTLNIGQHIKDAANAFEFEVPVSQEFYDKAVVGEDIEEKFRAASFWIGGSIGSWHVRCTGKRIAGAP